APQLPEDVVNGMGRRHRFYDSKMGVEITAGKVILQAAITVGGRRRRRLGGKRRARTRTIGAKGSAIFETRLDSFAAAKVIIDAAGIVEDVAARGDVDEADRAQSVFGGQGARDKGQAADEIGVEDAAETADAVGQHHAVDAKLQIGVIIAHVKKTARRAI